jgi:endo-1,3-1,4-beta-glycanase ExoK
VNFDFDATEAFNDYAFEWLPSSIRWYVNGRLIREVRKDRGDLIPSRKQKIYVSIWNGIGVDQEVWLGRFSYPGRPLVAAYEHIAFTRMGSGCQFPDSIVCEGNAAGRDR